MIGAILATCVAYFAFGTVSAYARPHEVAQAATNFSAFMALAGLLSVGSTVFGFRAFYLVAKHVEALTASKDAGV